LSLPRKPLLLLDACCLLNLLATSRTEEILRILPFRFATSRLVAEKEVLTLARDSEGTPLEREILSPTMLEELPGLDLLELSTEQELSDFVRLAMDLDDGEASVCALAIAHGGGLATDDRKALRVFHREVPTALSMQTPELLYDWARLSKATDAEIRSVLVAVRRRARFYPRKDVPRSDWWLQFD
jgi:hypothetical protein